MENVKIREFLDSFHSFGFGSGRGFGPGSGDGSGYGSGSGDGNGDGFSSGRGSGFGFGNGDGIKSVNGIEICNIDGVQTAIFQIHGNIAKGAILQGELKMCIRDRRRTGASAAAAARRRPPAISLYSKTTTANYRSKARGLNGNGRDDQTGRRAAGRSRRRGGLG